MIKVIETQDCYISFTDPLLEEEMRSTSYVSEDPIWNCDRAMKITDGKCVNMYVYMTDEHIKSLMDLLKDELERRKQNVGKNKMVY